ncbi:hypothetical protein [uncultured Parasphingorhabdus sp.]|uniref:hypothetical protein n=1 Tax=uncultured Parasphingorhabdus sp. TaxID=2709694 RepID=UPI0030DD731A|tara:strand:+ start:80205 stop:80651 length:447 start_codon:yes stop_codon:yes gene_type:complete
MKQRVRGVRRVLKVRDTQKRLKELALLQAGSHCASMEDSAKRIKRLHAETHRSETAVTAGSLAAMMELSDRLLEASDVVEVSVQNAMQNLAAAERQNLAAQVIHDGTERLLKSKVSMLRKMDARQADYSGNMLYNIVNYQNKERSDDW